MKKILIVIAVVIVAAAAYVYFADPGDWFKASETESAINTSNSNSAPFVGERTVQLTDYPGKTCQEVCEEAAGQPCYDYFKICQNAGVNSAGGLLQACSDYFQGNPQALKQYRCTFTLPQTSEGDYSQPCSFTCR